MAAGQPTTGIGGIFYLILFIGMLINRLFGKIYSLLHSKNMKEKTKRIIQKLPPFAFVVCIILLLYMNITGVRFATSALGAGSVTWTMDLGITGPFALSVFFIILMLFYIRSAERAR